MRPCLPPLSWSPQLQNIGLLYYFYFLFCQIWKWENSCVTWLAQQMLSVFWHKSQKSVPSFRKSMKIPLNIFRVLSHYSLMFHYVTSFSKIVMLYLPWKVEDIVKWMEIHSFQILFTNKNPKDVASCWLSLLWYRSMKPLVTNRLQISLIND